MTALRKAGACLCYAATGMLVVVAMTAVVSGVALTAIAESVNELGRRLDI